MAIAKDAGFMITAEELKNAQADVSDEELEGAAGGICGPGASISVPGLGCVMGLCAMAHTSLKKA